ncbi:fatty acid [Musa troglodytarum]|uniref:Fatty acid n=1 Tax=Musa troglodytarum TaxID=320322 RepID=A0A9E7JSZ1_9LILI|nr:fatty acid [Musa troglodytarum]
MESRCPLLSITFSLTVLSIQLAISHASTTVLCQEAERQALIEFKRGFYDPSGRLSSWVGGECCRWEGVGCSNVTGRVIKLDLRNARVNLFSDCSDNFDYWYGDSKGCKWALYGDISPSLLSLPHLQHLDLSGNVFERRRIPEFLGSLRRLTYLNLSSVGVAGRVPEQLGNLSTLRHLDLSYNFYGLLKLYVEDPGWLSRLTSLRHLNMGWVSFRNASNWLQAFNALPHIQVVELMSCDLGTFPPSLPLVNFTSLINLDLRYNNINSTIPNWLFNVTNLEFLYLGGNDLNWLIPESIAKLTSLKALDLSQNTFRDGFIPAALSSLCRLQFLYLIGLPINDALANLEELYLRHSQLSGTLPGWLGNMENLKTLDLSSNFLYGSLPASLGNLSMLQTLDVSSNDLNGTIPDGIGQMKSLKAITGSPLLSLILFRWNSVRYCQDPSFRNGFEHRQLLRIQGAIPDWLPPSLEQLELSYNGITGGMPQYLPNLSFLGLSNNRSESYDSNASVISFLDWALLGRAIESSSLRREAELAPGRSVGKSTAWIRFRKRDTIYGPRRSRSLLFIREKERETRKDGELGIFASERGEEKPERRYLPRFSTPFIPTLFFRFSSSIEEEWWFLVGFVVRLSCRRSFGSPLRLLFDVVTFIQINSCRKEKKLICSSKAHSAITAIYNTEMVAQGFSVDLNKPLVFQVGHLGEDYEDWVHRPIVTKEIPRFFANGFMEWLTRTVWWVVPVIWLPVVFWCLIMSIGMGNTLPQLVPMVLSGILLWTLIEYSLHRFLFHMKTKGYWGNTIHYLFHGCHHKYPMDGLRLVFPPAATAIICVPFWHLLHLLMAPSAVPAVFGGGLLGYVIYDCTHYYLHHGHPSKHPAKHLKRFHLNHHFKVQNKGFGITSSLWDIIFGTLPPAKASLSSKPSLQSSKQGFWNNFFTLGHHLWHIATSENLSSEKLMSRIWSLQWLDRASGLKSSWNILLDKSSALRFVNLAIESRVCP